MPGVAHECMYVPQIYDASTLISFYKYKWPFVYLYSALAVHLLLTDVFSIVIFVGSARSVLQYHNASVQLRGT